jgi:uncharacterized membrane protein
MESIRKLVEWSATGIEVATVLLLVLAMTFGTLRFLLRLKTQTDAYSRYRLLLGKTLILTLEFLVAADIIRTVALEQTLENVAILGLLVVIRTFLSWSLSVEIEGHWPWSHVRTGDLEDERHTP